MATIRIRLRQDGAKWTGAEGSADIRGAAMMDRGYRSIFHSLVAPADAFAAAGGELRAWLGSKDYDLDAVDRGEPRIADGAMLLYTAANSVDGAQTRNWRLREKADGGEWAVSLTVHGPASRSEESARTWFWTEVEFAPDVGRPVGAWIPRAGVPRLVRALLGRIDALDGSAVLANEPVIVGADRAGELIDVLCDPDRRLPAAVAAVNPAVSLDEWRSTISRITREITGVASVYLLGPLGTDAFNRAIGESHSVWGGALRTFLPGVDPAVAADGARHRVLSAGRMMADPRAATMIISGLPRRLALEAPLPEALAGVSRMLLSRASSTPDALDVGTLRTQVEQLGLERDLALDLAAEQEGRANTIFRERSSALARLAEREAEVLGLHSQVKALRRRIFDAGKVIGAEISAGAEEAPPADFAALIDWVEKDLSYVVFTGAIDFPLELDASPESSTWVRSSWEALLALESYAETKVTVGFRGDFKTWCDRRPSTDTIGISSGRVKLRESETVQHNKKWMQERLFPVPAEIDVGGRVHMEAHIAIGASSAGHLNPRLYYFDATSRTGLIYIGYLGRHLTNTRS
jgi:hypothetical protein